jgi:GTP-binding protein
MKTTINATFVGSYKDVRRMPADNRAQIAFAGRSNVGKSTLLNILVGQKKLAKTSKTPGRTQMMNFFLINDKYYIVDLPGYGYAKASVKAKEEWGRLVNKYLETSPHLAGIVLLLDCRRDPNENDLMMIDWIESGAIKYTLVLTKTDKLSKSQINKKADQIERAFRVKPILFSSRSGFGRIELSKWIENLVRNRK